MEHGTAKINLCYGKEGLVSEVPAENLTRIVRPRPRISVANPTDAITQALAHPIGALTLQEIARIKKSVCIVITDNTRPTPNHEILPVLLGILESSGVNRRAITILISNGLHEALSEDEIISLVGPRIASQYRIINHDAVDEDVLVDLGSTPYGTPVFINKHYMQAELKILTGVIEPHFMAGFSGGRKCLCPGIAGVPTIRATHSASILEHENAATGSIENNPFHQVITSAAEKAGCDFLLNVLLDDDKKIWRVVAGHMLAAHDKGVQLAHDAYFHSVQEQSEVVLTTGGGFPLDQNFYQTVKGITCASEIAKPGGTIIVASRCSQGVGAPPFRELLNDFASPEEFLCSIREPEYFKMEQWQMQKLCQAMAKAEVLVFSEGLDDESIRSWGMIPIGSVEEGIRMSLQRHGSKAHITVLPHGPKVIAQLES